MMLTSCNSTTVRSKPCVFVCFRARRRKLRNKAKTLLEDDTSQENEENYARRLMQGGNDVSSMSSLTKHGALGSCHGEYTQMWELRRSQPLGGAQPVSGSDSGLDSTYSTGTASIPPNATLPTCCNSKTTFITFKRVGTAGSE